MPLVQKSGVCPTHGNYAPATFCCACTRVTVEQDAKALWGALDDLIAALQPLKVSGLNARLAVLHDALTNADAVLDSTRPEYGGDGA